MAVDSASGAGLCLPAWHEELRLHIIGAHTGWEFDPVSDEFDPHRWRFVYYDQGLLANCENLTETDSDVIKINPLALPEFNANRNGEYGSSKVMAAALTEHPRQCRLLDKYCTLLMHSDPLDHETIIIKIYDSLATANPTYDLSKPNGRHANKPIETGTVISISRDKTATVMVEYMYQHKKYRKRIRKRSKRHVHDEYEQAHLGDTVVIRECRPLSKTKHHVLVEIKYRNQLEIV